MVFISSSLKKIFPLTHWPAAPVGLTGEPVNPTGAAGQRYNRTLHTVMTTVIIAIKFVIVKSFFKQSLRLLIDLCIFGLSTIAQRECRHHAIADNIEIKSASVTIQAFLEGKTIWSKTIKALRTIVFPLMVLPWFLRLQRYPLNSYE
ncbi:MAG: hypothetical protein ONB44_21820 [candidate division KSB1 bacterium]|nr:hypothetical protein [candidate division KSB1 bacterium]MDZ7314435.1 hypothetical protein [candidate division KSB1 bacterium]